MVPVRNLETSKPATDLLEQRHGYHYWPYKTEVMHWLCKPSEHVRTHHLHIVPIDSPLWRERLMFRDALREDSDMRDRYSELKRRLAQAHSSDREAYTVGKTPFVAWLVAEAIEEAPGAAWLALPVMLAAAAPAVQWAAHQSDAARALERAASVLAGPPERGADVRAAGFDHLGMMFLARGDYARADDALGRSVDAAPNPRVVVQWGMCAALRNEPALARDRYLRAVELNPALTVGWKGVAASASALGDANAMSRAVEALERLAPNDPTTRDARAWLEANRPAAR